MRAPLRTLTRTLTRTLNRTLTTSARARSAWSTGPAPPRLPKEEQELFERLQRQSTGAFSTPKAYDASAPSAAPTIRPQINQSPHSAPSQPARSPARADQSPDDDGAGVRAAVSARGDGAELHPAVRRGAPPEFEGDVNPKTGEVGGPKNEPLRWGYGGDWSYNGRVTDF